MTRPKKIIGRYLLCFFFLLANCFFVLSAQAISCLVWNKTSENFSCVSVNSSCAEISSADGYDKINPVFYLTESACAQELTEVKNQGFCLVVLPTTKEMTCTSIKTSGLDKAKCEAKEYNTPYQGFFQDYNQCQEYLANAKTPIPAASDKPKVEWQPLAPKLSINIPTLQPFSTKGITVPDSEGYIYIPFIGQYLAGIYRWALLAVGLVAVFFIISGGFIFMTSGGNAQRASEGKERIIHALFGLLILLGSYTILYLINPGLVEFRSLKIKLEERKELKIFSGSGGLEATTLKGAQNFNTSVFDDVFKKLASCSGLDWRIAKSIAYRESALNPNIKNPSSNTTGLFQCQPAYCQANLKPLGWSEKCDNPGLTNPEVNAAFIGVIFKKTVPLIEKKCGAASLKDKAFLLHYGNCVPGFFAKAIDSYGCNPVSNPEKWKSASADPCFKYNPFEHFVKTANLVESLGVTQFADSPTAGDCLHPSLKP